MVYFTEKETELKTVKSHNQGHPRIRSRLGIQPTAVWFQRWQTLATDILLGVGQALFFMNLNSEHLGGWFFRDHHLPHFLLSHVLSLPGPWRFNLVLFGTYHSAAHWRFFSSLYLHQGGCLLEMSSMTSAGALLFTSKGAGASSHWIWAYERSVLLNYSFVNNSLISIYASISHCSWIKCFEKPFTLISKNER